MLARGAGLHAMDGAALTTHSVRNHAWLRFAYIFHMFMRAGGAIGAAVSACGLTALLELATAIAKGYNSPLRRAHSMLLWSVALPLHAPENFGPTWQFFLLITL